MSSLFGKPLSKNGIREKMDSETRSRFEKNRELLQKKEPEKTHRLGQTDLSKSRFTTIPSVNGDPCLIGFRKGGQLIGLDDPVNPVDSHIAWFQRFQDSHLTHAILLGFGAGHIHRELADLNPKVKKLAVIEPHIDQLAVACATYDLSGMIENPRVSVWTPEDGYYAALWTQEWMEGFDPKEGDQVGFFLNPYFLRSAPEFLADYFNWLHIKEDRFSGIKSVLDSKFPHSPGMREDWEWGITLTGVKALAGVFKGLTGVIVGGANLSEVECEYLRRGNPENRVVLSRGNVSPELNELVDGFVLGVGDSFHGEILPNQQIFAEAAAACSNPLPPDTVIFRTESPPQRDQIYPKVSTLGMLKNKGTLIRQVHSAGTLIDLVHRLGCSDILLLGLHPERPEDPLDFEGVGLAEQMRQSKRRFYTFSKQTSEWLLEPTLITPDDMPDSGKRREVSLAEAVETIRKKPPSLPAPKFPIDRALKLNGEELVTQGGVLKKPSEGNLLEILFRENLEVLTKARPDIASLIEDRIANPSPEEAYQIGIGAEGFPHLAIVKDQKRIGLSPLTSNPWKDVVEAQSWNCLFTECANMVIGLGLGFHLESILERTSGRLMIWEPSVDRLMAAMHVRNLAGLFTHDRLDWVVGKSAYEAAGEFVDTRTQQMYYQPVNWEPFVEPGMRLAYEDHKKEFLNHFYPRIYEIRGMRKEAISSARNWAIHFLRNAPRKAEAASLRQIRGRFKGVPAIVVSAGPSLDENVHLLNEVKDRALIFVVDTSFRVVADRDIDRHFVVSVDQKEATLLHFANRTPRDTDILIATSGAPPLVWDLFKGPSFFGEFETGSGEKSKILSWLSDSLRLEEEYLFRGNSVAITTIGAAHILGCDPIVLIGQDLSIMPDRTHAEGTIYPVRPGLAETGKKIMVPAIGGGEVQTTQMFRNIQNNLEYTLHKHQLNVINSTARGASIRGTREEP
ncbi:MAG: DUF115 domain-containing protein, partial [Candidatus Omnitrophica bacterium]|nr:DUF115 domain-containing protein [Candidatus Omnitrophota bacterium]